MRSLFVLAFCLVLVRPVMSARLEVSEPYLGWGGPGEQVFRSKISVVRNHPNHDRAVMVIVDDLARRGSRLGIARVTVTYTGGKEASAALLNAIRGKTYTYPMIKMYKEAPLSPRLARVVLPQAAGVTATFRFYNTLHPPMDRSQEKGFLDAFTVAMPTERMTALPLINPMRDRAIRKPRRGDPVEPEPARPAEEPETGPVASGGGRDEGAPGSTVAALSTPRASGADVESDAEGGSSREARAMERARQLASQMRPSNRFGAGSYEIDGSPPPEPASDEDEEGETGVTSVDGVRIPSAGRAAPKPGVKALDDTPEMVRAQQRALERIRKMGLGR